MSTTYLAASRPHIGARRGIVGYPSHDAVSTCKTQYCGSGSSTVRAARRHCAVVGPAHVATSQMVNLPRGRVSGLPRRSLARLSKASSRADGMAMHVPPGPVCPNRKKDQGRQLDLATTLGPRSATAVNRSVSTEQLPCWIRPSSKMPGRNSIHFPCLHPVCNFRRRPESSG